MAQACAHLCHQRRRLVLVAMVNLANLVNRPYRRRLLSIPAQRVEPRGANNQFKTSKNGEWRGIMMDPLSAD